MGDEIAYIQELLTTTMEITRRAKPENLRSLAGGPGGPRRFSVMKGQATSRANAPYLGVNPATHGVGRGGGKKPDLDRIIGKAREQQTRDQQ